MKKILALAVAVILLISFAGCGRQVSDTDEGYSPGRQSESEGAGNLDKMEDLGKTEALEDIKIIVQTNYEIEELEKGLSAVRYEGEDGFTAFLSGGGAKTDGEVMRFLADSFLAGNRGAFTMDIKAFGCSTLSVQNSGSYAK